MSYICYEKYIKCNIYRAFKLMERAKNITFDEIFGTGRPNERMLISPSSNAIFNVMGEEIGLYKAKKIKKQTLIFV